MGNFFIWIAVSVVFGLICSVIYTWLLARKDKEPADNTSSTARQIGIRTAWFALIGLVMAGILNIIFAG